MFKVIPLYNPRIPSSSKIYLRLAKLVLVYVINPLSKSSY